MIIIKEIKAEETFSIRKEVLRKNIPLPYEFKGDFDDDTIHLGAFKDGLLVGVSSFMKSSNTLFKGNQYQLRGMATLTEYQGLGVGKRMVLKIEELLTKRGIDLVWCNARIVAVGFYKKLGYQIIGDPFEIKYIGTHYVMFKKIK